MPNASSEILDQRPPADPGAERWVIGSAILRPSVLDELGFLKPSDFYDETLRTLFAALCEMHRAGRPIDVGLLGRHFRSEDWRARIAEILYSVPHAGNAGYYGRIVARLSTRRRLREIGVDLVQHAHCGDGDPQEVLETVETQLAGVRMAEGEGEPVTLGAAAVEAVSRIDEIQRRGQSAGLPTGLVNFDTDQGGLFPGELTILAARPGVGKTSLALQVAHHNAGRGRLVYFASLEMSAAELSIRVACGEAGVNNQAVRGGRLPAAAAGRLSEALRHQSNVCMEIHDRPALRVASIRREIRRRKKRDLALAILDYLQLVAPEDPRMPREQQVARIVRSLKETAREYRVPILCLCQLNRQADGDSMPRLSHLRESGSIEQDADVVLFLSRHEPTNEEPHNAVLTVAKNRNGPTGSYRLNWFAAATRFEPAGSPNRETAFDAFSG